MAVMSLTLRPVSMEMGDDFMGSDDDLEMARPPSTRRREARRETGLSSQGLESEFINDAKTKTLHPVCMTSAVGPQRSPHFDNSSIRVDHTNRFSKHLDAPLTVNNVTLSCITCREKRLLILTMLPANTVSRIQRQQIWFNVSFSATCRMTSPRNKQKKNPCL